MIRNYIKVALRNLTRHKSYLLINTLGMGIALTCCLAVYLLIAYNLEFDARLEGEQLKNITKVVHELEQPDGERYQQLVAPIVMAPVAAAEIAGIREFTRYCSANAYISFDDKAFTQNVYFADAAFFNMFPLKLTKGSYKNYESPRSIFLSERLAKKYFANEDPIGKTLAVELNNTRYEVSVGGVMEQLPLNSSFTHDALMRIETYLEVYQINPGNWGESRDASLLFELQDIDQREAISRLLNNYIPLRNKSRTDSRSVSFNLVSFSEAFSPNEIRESYLHLRIPAKALVIFIALGTIILLIACFNLTNTTMALTGKRLKEIGVRKVVGSSRWQIVSQFLLEIIVTILLAVVAGLTMAQFVVPEFAAMWGLEYGLWDLSGSNLLMALIILLLVSAVLAGSYPALFNSKFSPMILLKSRVHIKGTNPLTRILLLGQFSLSVIVLIAGIIFTQNAAYQQKVSYGYDKEKVITVTIQGSQEYERLKNAITANPRIEQVAVTHNHIGYLSSYPNTITVNAVEHRSNVYEVGANYFSVMGLDIVSGRDFMENSGLDAQSAAVVDENFVKKYGLTNPIGTRIIYQQQAYSIIGVVKNHLSSLFDKGGQDKDHFYRMARPEQYQVLVARTDAGTILQTQQYIEQQWKNNFPGKPFQSALQEDIVFSGPNEYNKNLKGTFLFLTLLGCLLSASGIYSLASLNVQKRTKEIGVRKVLGASVNGIVALMNREFALILLLAMVLGGGGGYLLTNALLGDLYVQHIDVSLLTVVLCGLFVFAVGISTTSFTILRAARANPTKTLKEN